MNKPAIPTTQLPAGGRKDPAPECPYDLGEHGARWWGWAWATPQAAGWSVGDVYFVARRASFEDLMPTLGDQKDRATLTREMRESDDRLGLSPKGLAALRWKIVEEDTEAKPAAGRKGLTLVDKAG